jgi:hypothetical protein
MLDLAPKTVNKKIVHDPVSDTPIEFWYRLPTTNELVGYQAKLYKRDGNKLKVNAVEARLDYGLRIITGFRDGDIGIDGKAISADPTSPGFYPQWKDLLKASAAHLVIAFAFHVFEGTRIEDGNVAEIEFEGEVEEVPPFQSTSNDSGSNAPSTGEKSVQEGADQT